MPNNITNINGLELTTPVAFPVLTSSDLPHRFFKEIRRAHPPKLLVVADDARAEREELD